MALLPKRKSGGEAGSCHVLPGGLPGQHLSKRTALNYDLEWTDPKGGGSGIESIRAGTGIVVDATDGANPEISVDPSAIPASGVLGVVAGTGIAVNDTNPAYPVVSATGSGGSLPPGGDWPQVLFKLSDVDGDADWATIVIDGGVIMGQGS